LGIFLAIPVLCTLITADCGGADKGKSPNAAPPRAVDVPKQPTFVEEESPPALKGLADRLAGLLQAECPDAAVSLCGTEITVRYRTQKFMIHGQSKSGEFSERAHEEEGPKFRGFRLHVYFHEKRPLRALEVPSDVPGPYWTTFVNDYAIGSGKEAGFASVSLAYNYGTDPKLLEKVKVCLADDTNPKR